MHKTLCEPGRLNGLELGEGGITMSKNTERKRKYNQRKRARELIENSTKNQYGHTDLTPFNVGRKNIVY